MFTVWEILGASVGAGIGVVILPYLCLCVLGFTCGGIKADSCAACCQSGIGNVKAGGCFACCQSAGAGGIGGNIHIFLFLVGFVTTVTLMAIYNPEDAVPTSEPSTTFPNNFSQLLNATTPFQ